MSSVNVPATAMSLTAAGFFIAGLHYGYPFLGGILAFIGLFIAASAAVQMAGGAD